MFIAGIDASINSTGITRYELDPKTLLVKKKRFLGFTTVKKIECVVDAGEIIHFKKRLFNNPFDQNIFMRNHIMDFCKDCDYIAIEGYSYGSKGLVFNIAEYTGLLKHAIYEKNIPLRIYDPGSIKLFATQKGNADKFKMEQQYEIDKKKDKDYFDLNILPKERGPKLDIIDSLFITKLLQMELMLRHGLCTLSQLSENIIKIFNRVTKANPENLLVTDFMQIQKGQ